MTQVAGRAGRAEKAGQVLIQSYNPQHYAIRFAKDQDYEAFTLMNGNQTTTWLSTLLFTIGITLSHKKEEEVVKRAYEVWEFCDQVYRKLVKSLTDTKTHCPYPQPLSLPDFD